MEKAGAPETGVVAGTMILADRSRSVIAPFVPLQLPAIIFGYYYLP